MHLASPLRRFPHGFPTFNCGVNDVLYILNELKDWTDINKKLCEYIDSKKHDGILSLDEQIFDCSLEEENMIIDHFFIKDAYHGPIEYPENEEDIKKTEKAICNHPKTLKYINDKLRKIQKFSY